MVSPRRNDMTATACQDFKNKMKVGSRVKFDSHGLPVADERDPVIQAARETTKVTGSDRPSRPLLRNYLVRKTHSCLFRGMAYYQPRGKCVLAERSMRRKLLRLLGDSIPHY